MKNKFDKGVFVIYLSVCKSIKSSQEWYNDLCEVSIRKFGQFRPCVDLSSLTHVFQYISCGIVRSRRLLRDFLPTFFYGELTVTKTTPFVGKFLNAFCPRHLIMSPAEIWSMWVFTDWSDNEDKMPKLRISGTAEDETPQESCCFLHGCVYLINLF